MKKKNLILGILLSCILLIGMLGLSEARLKEEYNVSETINIVTKFYNTSTGHPIWGGECNISIDNQSFTEVLSPSNMSYMGKGQYNWSWSYPAIGEYYISLCCRKNSAGSCGYDSTKLVAEGLHDKLDSLTDGVTLEDDAITSAKLAATAINEIQKGMVDNATFKSNITIIVADIGVKGVFDQSIGAMLNYDSGEGNVETDLDSTGGTTPSAVYKEFVKGGYALNSSNGWIAYNHSHLAKLIQAISAASCPSNISIAKVITNTSNREFFKASCGGSNLTIASLSNLSSDRNITDIFTQLTQIIGNQSVLMAQILRTNHSVYFFFVNGTRETPFKADVSSVASSSQIDELNASLRTKLDELNQSMQDKIDDLNESLRTKISDTNASITSQIQSSIAGLANITVGDIFNEVVTGYTTINTFGAYVNNLWSYLTNETNFVNNTELTRVELNITTYITSSNGTLLAAVRDANLTLFTYISTERFFVNDTEMDTAESNIRSAITSAELNVTTQLRDVNTSLRVMIAGETGNLTILIKDANKTILAALSSAELNITTQIRDTNKTLYASLGASNLSIEALKNVGFFVWNHTLYVNFTYENATANYTHIYTANRTLLEIHDKEVGGMGPTPL